MEQFVQDLTATHLVGIGLGIVLLLFGRRLFWLALGGLGFLIALELAHEFLPVDSPGLRLGLAFLAGLVGAVVAVMAQRLAVALAGLLGGGYLGFVAVGFWQPTEVFWFWTAIAIGALFGVFLSSLLFDAALIALSSLAGAALLSQGLDLGYPLTAWIFLGLLCLGVMVQAQGRSPRRRRRRD